MATPRADGFVMPAEWAPHERCWMLWPELPSVWDGRLAEAQAAYMDVAVAIAEFEPVTLVARPESMAQASLMSGEGVSVLGLPHNDSWVRDTGPSFLIAADGRVAGVHWGFDGYGVRIEGYEVDAELGARVLDHVKAPAYRAPLVFEGGAVHVDGEGTGLVCAGSALDQRRNSGVTRERVEAVLRDYLAIETLIWLEHGLIDDDTSGHVDNLACFVRPGAVLALVGKDDQDPDFAGLQDNLARLRGATDAKGRTLEVIELLQPPVKRRPDGRRLTRSYMNFYLANGAVILPVFEEATDDAALRVLRQAFPDRTVVPVVANDIVWGGGGIHCITQQQPRPPAPGSA